MSDPSTTFEVSIDDSGDEQKMVENDLYGRLLAEIEKIPLVDTHEHLFSERARCRQKIDFFGWFAHYSSTDLVSAGMSPATLDMVRDPGISLDERWNHVAPFWKDAKTTGYGHVLLRAARDLFDVPDTPGESFQTG